MKALWGWARAAHPFPLAMVMLLTALLAFASSDGASGSGRFGLLLVAMLTSQLAIGWSNDYLDRDADEVHQPDKPVPSGLVDSRFMPPAIVLALGVSAVTGIALGLAPFLLLAVGTSCGLAYNLGLKRTRFSPAPYVVAFAVLPLFVWTALDVFKDEFLALYGIGITLPVAAHVANVLPDRESDLAQGRRTVAVALGRRGAVALAVACQLAPLPLLALSTAWVNYDAALLAPAVVAYGALSAGALALYAFGRDRDHEVQAFRFLVLGAVIFASGLLAAL